MPDLSAPEHEHAWHRNPRAGQGKWLCACGDEKPKKRPPTKRKREYYGPMLPPCQPDQHSWYKTSKNGETRYQCEKCGEIRPPRGPIQRFRPGRAYATACKTSRHRLYWTRQGKRTGLRCRLCGEWA